MSLVLFPRSGVADGIGCSVQFGTASLCCVRQRRPEGTHPAAGILMHGAEATCLLMGRGKLEEIDLEEKHKWFSGLIFHSKRVKQQKNEQEWAEIACLVLQ